MPMKPAEKTGEVIQLVSFKLDSEEYAIHVLKVIEVIHMSKVTRVPNAPGFVKGVINLRGKVIPIISLRSRFNLGEVEYAKKTRIMIIDVAGTLMGFIVDAVSEVIRIPAGEIQITPSVASGCIEQDCMSGVINIGGKLLILLSPENIFTVDETRKFSSTVCTAESVEAPECNAL